MESPRSIGSRLLGAQSCTGTPMALPVQCISWWCTGATGLGADPTGKTLWWVLLLRSGQSLTLSLPLNSAVFSPQHLISKNKHWGGGDGCWLCGSSCLEAECWSKCSWGLVVVYQGSFMLLLFILRECACQERGGKEKQRVSIFALLPIHFYNNDILFETGLVGLQLDSQLDHLQGLLSCGKLS